MNPEPFALLLLRRAPEDVPALTSDGVEVAVLREEQLALQEADVVRALGLAIWERRSAPVIRDAVGVLDPGEHASAESFVSVFSEWVFGVGQGVDVEPMTMLGRVVADPERVNGEIAELAKKHPAVVAFDRAEEEFRAVWSRAEGRQRREYFASAQIRANELHPGAIVRPWTPGDGIQPTQAEGAAMRVLRDAVEQYARERVTIIGTPFASGTVDADTVVDRWEQGGMTWRSVLSRVTADFPRPDRQG